MMRFRFRVYNDNKLKSRCSSYPPPSLIYSCMRFTALNKELSFPWLSVVFFILFKITMIIISIVLLLLSNAMTSRRDMSIIFNRVAVIDLVYSILQANTSLSMVGQGIGLHGGLLHISYITLIFHIFIFFISILILQLTSFYPRKV